MTTRAQASGAPSRRATALLLLSGGAILTGLAAWLIVARSARPGGATAAGSGVLLLAGSGLAARDRGAIAAFVASARDRAVAGRVASALAGASMGGEPVARPG